MGTVISLLLPETRAAEGAAVARTLFAEWEQCLSRFLPESELSRLNRRAGEPVAVSALLWNVLTTALAAARATDGLYDPTLLYQLLYVGYDRSFDDLPATLPASRLVPRAGGGWRAIVLEASQRRVTLPRDAGLDFGGIAKGMAVDATLARLRALGMAAALVNAGGDLAVFGRPAALPDWPIAVAGRDTTWTVPLRRGAMATSSRARRQWQQGPHVRHHLLDPRSGASAHSGLWSVTVVAGRCEQAEVAAKAAFLLGAQAGAEWLRAHDLAALLVCDDGQPRAVGSWPTEALEQAHE